MPQLRVTRGTDFDREYPITEELGLILIGRAAFSDICLADDPAVSRQHAAVVRAKGADRYFLRDLGSLSLSRVGGRVVYQHLLSDGDVIEIGSYRLAYHHRSPRPAAHCPIRVVPGRPDPDLSDRKTEVLIEGDVLGALDLSEDEQELIESVDRELQVSRDLSHLLSRILPGVIAVTSARRGFAAVLTERVGAAFTLIASVELGTGGVIEITTLDYLARLRAGQAVCEGHTLLVPIISHRRTIAFLCVERGRHDSAISSRTAAFLRTLGGIVAERLERTQRAPAFAPSPPLEWGIPLVARPDSLRTYWAQIERATSDGSNVLVLGETGTGKGLLAQNIHKASGRQGAFVHVRCPNIDKEVAETEVFGYVKNSGLANADPAGKPGLFELANDGTIFFDEIHALDPALQDKLLVVLDRQSCEKTVKRLHGLQEIPVHVKVIAATNKDVRAAIETGEFRAPLYHRFGVVIHIPLLRDRAADIPLLVHCVLDSWAATSKDQVVRTLSHRALNMLIAYDWPGNVRELENVLREAVARAPARTVLHSWDFDLRPQAAAAIADRDSRSGSPSDIGEREQRKPRPMKEIEEEQIREALEFYGGNKTRAATALGYSRMTLLNKMDTFGIERQYGGPA